jgi:HK97 family phage major capsid protein
MTTALGRYKNPIATGTGPVDAITGDLLEKQAGEAGLSVFEYLLEQSKKGFWYSPGRAISSAYHNKRNPGTPTGLEGEIAQELGRSRFERAGVPGNAFRVPWEFPIERRTLTVPAGAGSVTPQIQAPTDVLRNKMVSARLGAQILNLPGDGPKGTVQIPIRSGASSAFWVAESAAASSSAAQTIAITMVPSTVSVLTNITRRMVTSLGQPGFVDFTIEEMMTSCAVALDGAVINGSNIFSPFGLCQNPALQSVQPIGDTGTGGTLAYSCLEELEAVVGESNGDSASFCRLGFVTSPVGKSQLRKTDMSGTAGSTGRYPWHVKQHVINGELVDVETCLGWRAFATNAVPSGLAQGGGTANLTTILYGNWGDILINIWDSFAILVSPFQQSLNGTVQVSVFLDCASLLRRNNSFARCDGWAAS